MNKERSWLRGVLNREFIREVRGQSQDRLMVISSRSQIIGGVGVLLLLGGSIVNNPDAQAVGLLTAAAGFLGAAFTSLLSARRDLERIEADSKDQRN